MKYYLGRECSHNSSAINYSWCRIMQLLVLCPIRVGAHERTCMTAPAKGTRLFHKSRTQASSRTYETKWHSTFFLRILVQFLGGLEKPLWDLNRRWKSKLSLLFEWLIWKCRPMNLLKAIHVWNLEHSNAFECVSWINHEQELIDRTWACSNTLFSLYISISAFYRAT